MASGPSATVKEIPLAAFNLAGLGVILVDGNNSITYFNSACEELWGYTQSEIIGKDYGELFYPGSRSAAEEFQRQHSSRGKDSPEFLGLKKDGSGFVALFVFSKLEIAKTLHTIVFIHLVTSDVFQRDHARLLALVIDHTDRAVIIADKWKHAKTWPGFC